MAGIMPIHPVSLAVWDVPMPVVAGETFSIKAGAKSAAGQSLAGHRVDVIDPAGAVVASGELSATPLSGTEALHWVAINVPSPKNAQAVEYAVRFIPGAGHDALASRFSVVAAARPEHTLTVTITERDTSEALGGVELRLGPFHARTDKSGRAELRVAKGEYRIELWRTAHVAAPQPIAIAADMAINLTMLNVPEEHPDARWVR